MTRRTELLSLCTLLLAAGAVGCSTGSHRAASKEAEAEYAKQVRAVSSDGSTPSWVMAEERRAYFWARKQPGDERATKLDVTFITLGGERAVITATVGPGRAFFHTWRYDTPQDRPVALPTVRLDTGRSFLVQQLTLGAGGTPGAPCRHCRLVFNGASSQFLSSPALPAQNDVTGATYPLTSPELLIRYPKGSGANVATLPLGKAPWKAGDSLTQQLDLSEFESVESACVRYAHADPSSEVEECSGVTVDEGMGVEKISVY